jgi:hypothetical protein
MIGDYEGEAMNTNVYEFQIPYTCEVYYVVSKCPDIIVVKYDILYRNMDENGTDWGDADPRPVVKYCGLIDEDDFEKFGASYDENDLMGSLKSLADEVSTMSGWTCKVVCYDENFFSTSTPQAGDF